MTVRKESSEQRLLVRWLNQRQILFHATLNESASAKERQRNSDQGALGGVPDVLIFTRAPNAPWARGVAIELKRTKGGTHGPRQRQVAQQLIDEGWISLRSDGFWEAEGQLRALGFGAIGEG